MLTADDIRNIDLGAWLVHSVNGLEFRPRKVVEILYRGVSDKGRAYVGGYVDYGHRCRMSFSAMEGESFYRFATAEEIERESVKGAA